MLNEIFVVWWTMIDVFLGNDLCGWLGIRYPVTDLGVVVEIINVLLHPAGLWPPGRAQNPQDLWQRGRVSSTQEKHDHLSWTIWPLRRRSVIWMDSGYIFCDLAFSCLCVCVCICVASELFVCVWIYACSCQLRPGIWMKKTEEHFSQTHFPWWWVG